MRHLACALIANVFFSAPLLAGINPCDELTAGQQPSAAAAFPGYSYIQSLFSTPERQSEKLASSEYWFTKQPGRFATISCQDLAVEWQEGYVIGTVVRPVDIVDEKYLKIFRQVHGEPVLVETEYGHRKIVPLQAISPILPKNVYIFADEYLPTRICDRSSPCVSHDKDICGDACDQEISSLWGYAVADGNDPIYLSAREAHRKIDSSDLLLPKPQTPAAELSRAYDNVCEPFPVLAMKVGGSRHNPGNDQSHLTLCEQPPTADGQPASIGKVKFVDTAYARTRFGLFMGAFQRRMTASNMPGSILSSRIEKPCGLTTTNSLRENAGLVTGIGIDKIVQLGVEASIGQEFTRQISISSDQYILVMSYFSRAPDWRAEGESRPIRLFRVMVRANCNGTTISSAESISFDYRRVAGGLSDFKLLASSVNTNGTTADRDRSLKSSYVENNSVTGFAETQKINLIENGYFWHIKDHIAYFLWRDELRRLLASGQSPLLNLDLMNLRPQQQVALRDFYVHLALSSAFQYDDFCKKTDVTCERPQ